MLRWVVLIVWCSLTMGVYPESATVLYEYKGGDKRLSDLRSDPVQVYPYVLPIRHRDVQQVQSVLSRLYPDIGFAVEPSGRTLSFRSSSAEFKSIQAVIRRLEKPLDQLTLHVKIVEMNSSKFSDYEQLFSSLGNSFRGNLNPDTGKLVPVDEFTLQLTGLIQDGQASLLAEPRLTVLDNVNSKISVGDRIPFLTKRGSALDSYNEIQYIQSGIELDIVPKVLPDGKVRCHIAVKVSSIKYWKEYGPYEYPVLSSRDAVTEVVLEDGATLVLAGLYDTTTKSSEIRVPVLGSIPVLGRLFRKERQDDVESDIVFMIRPELDSTTAVKRKKALE